MRRTARLVVGSHNILDGLRLSRLLGAYRELHASERIAALCIQEAVPHAARRIASALGHRFAVAEHAGAPRLALVYDRTRLHLRGLGALALPKLAHVPLWQRIYTSSSPEPKQALVGRFGWRRRQHRRLTIANFHLDAAGDNAHRARQLRGMASALSPVCGRRLVACGDTNAFSLRRSHAERDLAQMLAPLQWRHGACDAHSTSPADTHFFARAHEPKLGQRIAVALGRLGIDIPRRYDVIASSLPHLRSGSVDTPDSDHNLVWASFNGLARRLALSAPPGGGRAAACRGSRDSGW